MTKSAALPRDFNDVLAKCDGVRQLGEGKSTAACPCPGHKHSDGHLSLTDMGTSCRVKCFDRHDSKEIAQALGVDRQR